MAVTRRSVIRKTILDKRAEELANVDARALAVKLQILAIRLAKDEEIIYALARDDNKYQKYAIEVIAASDELQATVRTLSKDPTIEEKQKSIKYRKAVQRLVLAGANLYASGAIEIKDESE